MAFTGSVALSLTSPQVITGAPANFIAAVTNGGVTAGTLTSLTLVTTPTSGAMGYGAVNLGPSVSLSLGGSSTVYFPASMVFQTPRHPYQPAAPTSQFLVHAEALFGDGTTATSPMLSIAPSTYNNTLPGANASTAFGQLRFDTGINSDQLVLISPP